MSVSVDHKFFSIMNILDSLSIPVFVINGEKNIISLNVSAASVYQCIQSDILGRHIGEFISDGSGGNEKTGSPPASFDFPATSGELRFEASCARKNGELFTAGVTVIPLHNDGQHMVILQDVPDRNKLEQRSSQRAKELSVFNAFARILTLHPDIGEILRATISMLLDHMGADKGWIYLMDEGTAELIPAAHVGFTGEQMHDISRLKPGESLTGKTFTSGRPLLVQDASADPRVKFRDLGIGSMVCVPITSKGKILGVLGIASARVSAFSSMDIQLLSIIGSQLGVAIENTKLISQLREKMEQIELTSELSGIINSSLSIGTIFRMVASEIRKLIAYDRASLLLYNEKENNLLIFALDTEMKTEMKKGTKAPIEGTSSGWVVKNNRPWINYDLSIAEFPLDRRLYLEGIRSTISIPLVHDTILGVFNLDSREVAKYSEKDLDILLPIAKHISIALENALLFEEISREKKEWEKTFDAITDMVWIEDGRQRVIRANHTLLVKAGLSAFQISGRSCREILNRIGINPVECLCLSTISTEKPSFREIKGTGGSIFHFWAYPLLDDDGRLYAIVHYLKDVTAREQLEQQLIRADKLASLGTLVAGIAHEINNPLGIIAGYSEALLERAKEGSLRENREFEDFPEYLGTIHKEIFRCKGILRSLLDFARPSGGTHREIDINELIKEVILLVNHRAKKLNHNITLKLNRDIPKIVAEPGSLRQLFMNIIINSMYFTSEGGSITISSGMAPEEERPENDAGLIQVSITDTGSGIPGNLIGKIFDPFFTTKPVGEGTGLGLAICHKIVEEHGGSIEVESEEGRGTVFTIKFPVTRARVPHDKSSCC
jgi:two-component system NtrC family sensor kinase